MRRLFASIVVFLLLVPAYPAYAQSHLEDEVLSELNLARTNPRAYKDILVKKKARFRGRFYRIPGGTKIITKEGVRAVSEAIRFLERQRPISPLRQSDGLRQVAGDLVEAEGPGGGIGHNVKGLSIEGRLRSHGRWERAFGEDISYGPGDARDVVSQLIIDDGVPDRGHRKNIFDPKFKVAGVACGHHARYGTMCVIDFAGGFRER